MKRLVFVGLGGVFLGLIIGFSVGQLWSAKNPGRTMTVPDPNASSRGQASEMEDKYIVQLSDEQIREFGIEVSRVGPAKLREQKLLSGEIVLDPDKVAYIVPRVSGIAVQINKTLGDVVQEGEAMAVIDSRELADAKAGYLAAVERFSLAQVTFDREKTLWEKKISSEEDYLNSKQALAEASIALRNVKQSLYSLGFNQDYLAKLHSLPDASYTRYEILAPFDGIVTARQIGLGEVVTDTSQIYQIADLNTVWAELTVYQKDLGSIRTGQAVVIRADNIDIEATNTIQYISPVINASTRTTTARVVIQNPNRTWLPGTFITGQVEISAFEVPIAVARRGVVKLSGQDMVFIQTNEGFVPKAIQLGRTDPKWAEILSGIKPDQRYVCANAFTLKAELSKSTFAGGDDD